MVNNGRLFHFYIVGFGVFATRSLNIVTVAPNKSQSINSFDAFFNMQVIDTTTLWELKFFVLLNQQFCH